jgi:flagellum-specific peptidoglycan hydrolase FlgJ
MELIRAYYQDAVKATQGTKLFPEVLVSQLVLESGYSLSKLARDANNYFGIKSGSTWTGRVISAPTIEYINDQAVKVPGNWKIYANRAAAIEDGQGAASLFRVYDNRAAGFAGWVQFLYNNPRYSRAGVFQAKTPAEQFAALARAQYATDPRYLDKLSAIYAKIKGFFLPRPR